MEGKIPYGAKPIMHTDQGLQYWHRSYHESLDSLDVKQGMFRRANCWANAPVESFFGHPKTGFFYRSSFKTVDEFLQRLNQYIDCYNNGRIRCNLNGDALYLD